MSQKQILRIMNVFPFLLFQRWSHCIEILLSDTCSSLYSVYIMMICCSANSDCCVERAYSWLGRQSEWPYRTLSWCRERCPQDHPLLSWLGCWLDSCRHCHQLAHIRGMAHSYGQVTLFCVKTSCYGFPSAYLSHQRWVALKLLSNFTNIAVFALQYYRTKTQ